jgi:hypothetical protein
LGVRRWKTGRRGSRGRRAVNGPVVRSERAASASAAGEWRAGRGRDACSIPHKAAGCRFHFRGACRPPPANCQLPPAPFRLPPANCQLRRRRRGVTLARFPTKRQDAASTSGEPAARPLPTANSAEGGAAGRDACSIPHKAAGCRFHFRGACRPPPANCQLRRRRRAPACPLPPAPSPAPCQLPTANCQLPTAACQLPTANSAEGGEGVTLARFPTKRQDAASTSGEPAARPLPTANSAEGGGHRPAPCQLPPANCQLRRRRRGGA